MKLEGLVFLPIMSMSIALPTFISQNLGAAEVDPEIDQGVGQDGIRRIHGDQQLGDQQQPRRRGEYGGDEPMLLGQFLQQLYNMADAWVLGNFADNGAFAAVSSGGNLTFLITKIHYFTIL